MKTTTDNTINDTTNATKNIKLSTEDMAILITILNHADTKNWEEDFKGVRKDIINQCIDNKWNY